MAQNAKSKAEDEVFNLGFAGRVNVRRSAFETLVRLAIVQQIADAVYRVFENRSSGKYDHPNCRIDKGNDVVSQFSVFLLCPASLISLPSGPAQWLFPSIICLSPCHGRNLLNAVIGTPLL